MSLFKRKKPLHVDGLPERLRNAERRLRGWTVSGDGIAIDRLLRQAADEIELLREEQAAEEPT